MKVSKQRKLSMKAYMKHIRIVVPKGYVGTGDAVKMLGISYKNKTRIHHLRHLIRHVILNDKRKNRKRWGRYFWLEEDLRKIISCEKVHS